MLIRPAALVAAIALAAAVGCGSQDDPPAAKPQPRDTRPAAPKPKTACKLIPAQDVRRVMRRVGARPPAAMKAEPDDTIDLSACLYRGRGGSVKLRIDTANRTLDRFFWALSERQQIYATKDQLRPRDVKGVGEDKAIGVAAAYWVPSINQLLAYGWDTYLKVDVDVRGQTDTAARRSAVAIARTAFRRRDR